MVARPKSVAHAWKDTSHVELISETNAWLPILGLRQLGVAKIVVDLDRWSKLSARPEEL